jgi:2-oxoglutarate ferredoxin oxidoreductase subunit gamma
MEHRCIFAGFGGQGLVSMGTLVAYAGMVEGRQVTFSPSYGIAMRGGMANCTVVVSDEEIRSPVVTDPSVLVAMNEAAFDCLCEKVSEGGWLFLNSSLVHKPVLRTDIKTAYVNATGIALEEGDGRMANMAMLGAVMKLAGVVSFDAVARAMKTTFSAKLHKLVDGNLKVMKRGFDEANLGRS